MIKSSPASRIGIQGPLGFAAGVPLLLTGSTLVAWLDDAKVSVGAIGLFSLVALPYNFKVFWAPLLDRYSLPLLGRRHGWMLLTQLLLLIAIGAMGTMDAGGDAAAIALFALSVATLSASLDVVVDAYRTDILQTGERGKGAAAYVAGYRIGMIVAGAGALVLADQVSWRATYWVMAALMTVGVVTVLFAPRTEESAPPANLRDAVVLPFVEFFGRRGALLAISFVALYKFGDSLAGHMIVKFLKDVGFTKTEIGVVQKFLGLGATILGCAIGGIIADRIGVLKGLLIFGVLQALANAGYMLLAITGESYPVFVAAIAIDNLCNGLGTAAFVAFLMSLCNRRFSATQYALLTSASSFLGRFVGAASGYLIAAVGWAVFFGISIGVAAPALILLVWYRRMEQGEMLNE